MKFSFLNSIKLTFTIGLASIICTPVQAQPAQRATHVQRALSNASRQFNQGLIFNAPLPPEDVGEPGDRVGGGKRGICKTGNNRLSLFASKPLTALVPVYSSSGLVLGLTTKDHPAFWFYVPYSNCPLEFVLKDDQDNYVYKTSLTTTETLPGVVSVRLPSTIAPLEIGKRYHWYFSVLESLDGNNPLTFVEGWVERVAVNNGLMNQLQTAIPRERLALYAANGIWHDALTSLAELRSTDPKDATLTADWMSLLQSIGLEAVSQEPITQCCTAKN